MMLDGRGSRAGDFSPRVAPLKNPTKQDEKQGVDACLGARQLATRGTTPVDRLIVGFKGKDS